MVAITTHTPTSARSAVLRLIAEPPARRDDATLARALSVVVLAVVVAAAVVWLAFSPAAGAGSAPGGLGKHVVEAGDTMWSIAREVAPAGEVATYVERLVAANETASPAVGQVIVLPAP